MASIQTLKIREITPGFTNSYIENNNIPYYSGKTDTDLIIETEEYSYPETLFKINHSEKSYTEVLALNLKIRRVIKGETDLKELRFISFSYYAEGILDKGFAWGISPRFFYLDKKGKIINIRRDL